MVLKYLSRTKEEVEKAVDWAKEELAKDTVEIDRTQVYQLYLDRLVEHRQEFWDNPRWDYISGRLEEFIKLSKTPDVYKVLVVPNYYDDESSAWFLAITMPFLRYSEGELVEKFMLTSKEVVDVMAKNSAMYVVTDILGYDHINKFWLKDNLLIN